jgi:2'-5' RNA ligase
MNGLPVRSFVCMPLPDAVIEKVEQQIAFVRRNSPQMKWVAGRLYHITLKFCGEQPVPVLNVFRQKVGNLLSRNTTGSIALRLGVPGAFPNLYRAHTFFWGLEGEIDKLKRLAFFIESAASECGIPQKRRGFHPHVTLARTNRPERIEIGLLKKKTAPDWVQKTVVLMKSQLRASGPEYSVMEEWNLL